MNKSSITFRRCKKHIQVYRTQYGNCHLRIFTLEKDLSNLPMLEELLVNNLEKKRLAQWVVNEQVKQRQQRIQAILERGPDAVMYDVGEALAELAKLDPKGELPEYHRIGIEIWGAWQKIYSVVGSKSAWKIEQKYALNKLKADPNLPSHSQPEIHSTEATSTKG